MAGRPSKFTEETKRKVIEAIRKGCPLELAGQLAGVAKSTIISWNNRGEEEEKGEGGPYADFMIELKRAEAEVAVEWLAAINAGGPGWQSAAWALERRHWRYFGRRSPIDTATNEKPTQVIFHLGHETRDIKGDSLTTDGENHG